jgi:hypothetical protein
MSDDKEIVYYEAKVNAWFNTKMEYDKSILVLSAGAIGLLLTLLTTVGVTTNAQLILFITALICFIVCIISVLFIFTRNADYIEKLIQKKNNSDPLLRILDYISIFSFISGILLATIIGIIIATNGIINRENDMTEKKETKKKIVIFKESFNGAQRIAPIVTDSMTASFNGAQKLAPLTTAPAKEIVPTSASEKVSTPQSAGQTQSSGSESKDKE